MKSAADLLARTAGDLWREQSKPSEAAKAYRRALSLDERRHKEDPTQANYQDAVARVQHHLALVLPATGRIGDAEKAYRLSIAASEKLAKTSPENPHYRHSLANGHHHLPVLLAPAVRGDKTKGFLPWRRQ